MAPDSKNGEKQNLVSSVIVFAVFTDSSQTAKIKPESLFQ